MQRIDDDFDVIVAPDVGRAKTVSRLAADFGRQQVILIKQRDEQGQVRIEAVAGEVKGKRTVVVDDMIDTGGTMIEALKVLKDAGAKDIRIVAAH